MQEFVDAMKAPAEGATEGGSLARGNLAQPHLEVPQELPELKNKEFAESTPSYGGYGGGYGGGRAGHGARGGGCRQGQG